MTEPLRKASEVRDRLTALIEEHGDQDLLIDVGLLYRVEEVDLGGSDEGFVVWLSSSVVEG